MFASENTGTKAIHLPFLYPVRVVITTWGLGALAYETAGQT